LLDGLLVCYFTMLPMLSYYIIWKSTCGHVFRCCVTIGAHDPRGYVGFTVDGAKLCESKIW